MHRVLALVTMLRISSAVGLQTQEGTILVKGNASSLWHHLGLLLHLLQCQAATQKVRCICPRYHPPLLLHHLHCFCLDIRACSVPDSLSRTLLPIPSVSRSRYLCMMLLVHDVLGASHSLSRSFTTTFARCWSPPVTSGPALARCPRSTRSWVASHGAPHIL